MTGALVALNSMETALQFTVFHNFPLWQIAVAVFFVMLVIEEAGYRLGLRRRKKFGLTDADLGGGGVVLNSIFALLGLILAFTYSSAVDRHELRKQTLVQEANALGTAFLRANILPEPGRAELKNVLYQYALTRVPDKSVIDTARIFDLDERVRVIGETLAAQARIWPVTQRLVLSKPPGPGEIILITGINDVLDLHTLRVAALYDKLPDAVVWMLLGITSAALSVAGFLAGIQGRMSRWRMIIMAAVLASVILVILDFDRPGNGQIQVRRLSLYSLITEMEADLDLQAGGVQEQAVGENL